MKIYVKENKGTEYILLREENQLARQASSECK